MRLKHLMALITLAIPGLVLLVAPQMASAQNITPFDLRVVDCQLDAIEDVVVVSKIVGIGQVSPTYVTDEFGRATVEFPKGSVDPGDVLIVTLSHDSEEAVYSFEYDPDPFHRSGGDWDFGEEIGGATGEPDLVSGIWTLPFCENSILGKDGSDDQESSWGALKSRHSDN